VPDGDGMTTQATAVLLDADGVEMSEPEPGKYMGVGDTMEFSLEAY